MVLPNNTNNNANNQQRTPGAADPKRPRILGGPAPVAAERPRVSFNVRVDASVNPNGTVDVSFRIPANIIPGIAGNLNIRAPLRNHIMGQGRSQPRAHGSRSVSTNATAAPTGNRQATAKKRTYYTREQKERAIGLLNGGMPCRQVAKLIGRDCGSGTPIRWRQQAVRRAAYQRQLAGILLRANQVAGPSVMVPQGHVPGAVEENPADGAAFGEDE